jgi:pilus assembly protein CpaB
MVSAVFVATALSLAISAFVPHSAPVGVPVVVVSEDLMAGHTLTPGDLAVADWPRDLSPRGALASPQVLVGRALGAGMSRGEPVTGARLRGPGLLAGTPTGMVAAHIRLADPAMAAMATPGAHVDLISSSGKLVAADVVLLAVDASPAGAGWSATSEPGLPGGVIVAVTRDAALRLATVDPSGVSEAAISMVMRKPST